MVKKYTKIPLEVEALEFVYSQSGIADLKMFCGDKVGTIYKRRHPNAKAEAELLTLEDGEWLKAAHIATEGDYIVKGVNGEFWAVKPDIFKLTYQEVK